MFTKIKSKPLVLAAFLAVALLVAVAVWFLGRAPSSEARSVIVQDYLDAEKTILYIGNVDDSGAPFAVVMYDASSPEAIRHYAAASRARGQELIDSGVTELYVWVTFRYPLDLSVFEDMVKQSGLDVKGYQLRALGQKGDRVTINGGPERGVLVPLEQLDRAMKGIQAHENNQAELKGVFAVSGVVSVEGYKKLVQDPHVFLVDVTGSLVYHHPAFKNRVRMGWKEFVDMFQFVSGSPFWYMENFGLEKFAADR